MNVVVNGKKNSSLTEVYNLEPLTGPIWMLAVVMEYDYVFCENGLVAYKAGKLVGSQVT